MENYKIYDKNSNSILKVESTKFEYDFHNPEVYHKIVNDSGTGVLISSIDRIVLVSFSLTENGRYLRGKFLNSDEYYELFVIKTFRDIGFSFCQIKTEIPNKHTPVIITDDRFSENGDELFFINSDFTSSYSLSPSLKIDHDGPIFDKRGNMLGFVNKNQKIIYSYSLLGNGNFILNNDGFDFEERDFNFKWQKTNQMQVDLIARDEGFSGVYVTSPNQDLQKGDLITHISYSDPYFHFEDDSFDKIYTSKEVTASIGCDGSVKICDVPLVALNEISLEDKTRSYNKNIDLEKFLEEIPYDANPIFKVARFEEERTQWLDLTIKKRHKSELKYVQPFFDSGYEYKFYFGLFLIENNKNLGISDEPGIVIVKILRESNIGKLGVFSELNFLKKVNGMEVDTLDEFERIYIESEGKILEFENENGNVYVSNHSQLVEETKHLSDRYEL